MQNNRSAEKVPAFFLTALVFLLITVVFVVLSFVFRSQWLFRIFMQCGGTFCLLFFGLHFYKAFRHEKFLSYILFAASGFNFIMMILTILKHFAIIR